MNEASAASHYDDLQVPDESTASTAAGARRPKELVPRERLEELSTRSDLQGLLYLGCHFAAIGLTGCGTCQRL